MIKRPLVFLATAFLLLTIVSRHNAVFAKDTWLSVRSKNFFVIGNTNEKDLRQVAVRLEQFREVFSRLFTRTNMSSPVPTTVVVFKSDSSYRPFKPNANTAGYFQPGPDVNYITLTTEVRGEQNPFTVIFHEYTHLLVDNNVANVPTWFNEGLAEYYSTFSITDDQKIELGRPIAGHIFRLRDTKIMPLRALFQVDQKSPYYNERDKQSVFYAESWALTHYLILGKNSQRRAQLSKFVDLLGAHAPMEKAFQEAFQTTFESMEKELREYINQSRYPFETGHFERKLELDTAMQTAPISEAEAQAYLGDLLLHSNRPESESYLQKALELDPNLAMAHATMGMLRFRQGKTDEARKSLERAAAANSQNYLIHYYYALTLSRDAMGDSPTVGGLGPGMVAKMREQLKKAIELRPDYPEPYSLLAFVNLVSGTDIDESIEMMKHAMRVSPGRNDFTFMLAQLYLHKQDYKTARQLLDQLNKPNVDETLRQRTQNLLTQLTTLEEQKARFEEMQKSSPSRGATPAEIGINVDATASSSTQTHYDPNSGLREVLRKPEAGETQLQATLIRIDCGAKGITFVVNAGGRQLFLQTDKFEHVDITTYTTDVQGDIGCGARKTESSVIISFIPQVDTPARDRGGTRSNAAGKTDGVLRSIEFVPKAFKLKPEKS